MNYSNKANQRNISMSFTAYAGQQWFRYNGPLIMALAGVVLGFSLIASEVSKGSIFFLLSKPVSRERVLLTKYLVNLGILGALSVLAATAIDIAGIATGYPQQDVVHMLVAVCLIWLGASFPLGLSLLFSVVFSDVVRPLVVPLVILVVLVLPIIFPNGQDWCLFAYWSNPTAYLSGGVPWKEYLVCFGAAVLPLVGALVIFHRKAF